jgi:hypothetical protein
MDKRIAEFAEQSGITFDTTRIPDTGFEYEGAMITLEELIAFTELVIKECVAVCEADLCNRKDDPPANYFDGGIRHCTNKIKQHFGVE